jgi:hypothetical protein
MASLDPSKEPPGHITSVTNEKNKTADEILEEMNSIWREARQRWTEQHITQDNHKALDKIFDDIRGRHRELYSSYPTVIRHALQEMRYSEDAFRKYLKRLSVKPWLNDEQRMDSYADYFILMYKSLNPRYNAAEAARLRSDYRNRLDQEEKSFRERYEVARREVEQQEKQLDKDRREYILAIAKKLQESKET